MQLVRTLPEEDWRRFVDEHPQGNVFHTPEMFQVFARAKGYRPSLWAVVDHGRNPLALFLPVEVTLKGGLLRRFTTRAVAYGSVLCDPSPEGREALDILLQVYRREADEHVLFTELRNLSDLEFLESLLKEHRFVHEDYLNYLIDLNKPTEEVWQGIRKSGRKAIRRSKNRGVAAEEVEDRALIPTHYDLLRKSYAQARVPLADMSLFVAAFDILVPKGMAKMFLARLGDYYVAASLELPYKDIIYSWYSGYDNSFRSVYPNDALVWQILEWGSENGYRSFDFGGAGRPSESYGPRDFKAKFGGQLVDFGRHTCVHTPSALLLSRMGYRIYQAVMPFLSALRRERPVQK